MSGKESVARCPSCGATDRWEIQYRALRCAACNNATAFAFQTLARELYRVGSAQAVAPVEPPRPPAAAPLATIVPPGPSSGVAPVQQSKDVGSSRQPINVVRDDRPIDINATIDSGRPVPKGSVELPKNLEKKVAHTLPGMAAEMNIAGGQAEIGMARHKKAVEAQTK